jgi:predicted nuclease with TOPRIM domain
MNEDISVWENEGGFVIQPGDWMTDTIKRFNDEKPKQKHIVDEKTGCKTCVSAFYNNSPKTMRHISEAEYNDLQRRFNALQGKLDLLSEEKAFQSEAIIFLKDQFNNLKEKLVPLAIEVAALNGVMLNAFALGVQDKDALISKNNAQEAKDFLLQFIIGKEKFDQLKELSMQKRYGAVLTTQNPKHKASSKK